MAVEFLLNTAMIVLLSATVFYCFILNKRIKILQDSRGELAALLQKFDMSTKRASHTMNVLQQASSEAGKSVQGRIEKAQYVLDDLNYMMDRAGKLADQMEAGIAIARQRDKITVNTADTVNVANTANTVDTLNTVNGEKKHIAPSAKTRALKTRAPQPVKAVNGEANELADELPEVRVTIPEDPQTFAQTSVSDIATDAVAYSDDMIEMKNAKPKVAKPASDQALGQGDEPSRDAILQSLRQAKAGGKESKGAISSLQSLIERVAERTQSAEAAQNVLPTAAAAAAGNSAPPSRSERELMKALEMRVE